MLTCTKCKQLLSKDNFSKRKAKTNGYRSQCVNCDSICNKLRAKKRTSHDERVRKLRYIYGLTVQDYNNMLKSQGGCCAICKAPNNSGDPRKYNFDIDHCHKTGKVRGLLCNHCNTGLGFIRDNIVNLVSAAKYIKISKTKDEVC